MGFGVFNVSRWRAGQNCPTSDCARKLLTVQKSVSLGSNNWSKFGQSGFVFDQQMACSAMGFGRGKWERLLGSEGAWAGREEHRQAGYAN